jgi:trypsin
MSGYALKKSTLLVILLLAVSKACADDQIRQLRGAGDPTPAENIDSSSDAEAERRELNAHRTVPYHHPHDTLPNKRHPKKGAKARSNHVQGFKPQGRQHMMMMKGGGLASRRHVTPGARNRGKHGRPVMTQKQLQSRGRSRGNHHPNNPKLGWMRMSNGRQSRHGANTEGQGSIQHVGKPSPSAGGDQNATGSTEGKPSFDSRIVGGFAAADGEYKFIATLYFGSSGGSLSFGCGGSLIAPDMVLTAAHCGGESVASIRIGSNSLESGGELRGVASQCIHPMYDATEISNDYMLVKLDSPVDTSEYPIIQLNQDTLLPQEDDMLTVIGFGLTTDGGDVSQTLQKVEIPMNSFELCNQQYGGDIEEDIQFCAGYVEGGKDSCQGDSGGPIFEMRGTTPVQVGVVSFGKGCAQPDRSGVYARVTGAYEWIQDTMAKLDAGDTSGCVGWTSSGNDDNAFIIDDDGSVGDDGGSTGDDGGSTGDDGGWATGDDGGWFTDDDGGWFTGDDGGWFTGDDGGWLYDDDGGWSGW